MSVSILKNMCVSACIVILLSVSGCDDRNDSSTVIDGIWASDGYGWVLNAQNGLAEFYQISSVSGIKTLRVTYSGNTINYDTSTITAEFSDEKLHLSGKEFGEYDFTKISELPSVCKNGGTALSNSPELNFQVFWNTFNEQYAFFSLRGVDWQNQYTVYHDKISDSTTQAELYKIFCDMIEPLNDSHCSICNNVDEFRTYDVNTVFELHEKMQSDQSLNKIGIENYISYKSINSDSGLIVIYSMGGYDDQAINMVEIEQLDQALSVLKNKKSIIIDMRFNIGGMDAVSLDLAGRFADRKRLAFSKKTRNGSGFTPVKKLYVEPEGSIVFTKKVIVLTSGFTVSAGETFVMAMRALPNVTVIGENTNGAHSDILGRILPNGWNFGLSNEVYYASDGICYEKTGLSPDTVIPFNSTDFLNGIDPIIEQALVQASE